MAEGREGDGAPPEEGPPQFGAEPSDFAAALRDWEATIDPGVPAMPCAIDPSKSALPWSCARFLVLNRYARSSTRSDGSAERAAPTATCPSSPAPKLSEAMSTTATWRRARTPQPRSLSAGLNTQFFGKRRERRASEPSPEPVVSFKSSVAAKIKSAATTTSFASSLMKPLIKKLEDPEVARSWMPERILKKSMSWTPNFRTGTVDKNDSHITHLLSPNMTATSTSLQGTSCEMRRRQMVVFLESRLYALVTCLVIVVNAVFIGLEQTRNLQGKSVSKELKYFFIGFYLSDLLFRFVARGFHCFKEDEWFRFDSVIVGLQIIGDVALQDRLRTGDSLLLLRIVRLSPLVRTLRPIVRFRVLKVLVKALMSSAGIMVNTVLMVLLFLYVFGVLGAEIIGAPEFTRSSEASADLLRLADRFADISTSMMTLVQFVCLDSIAAIYRPLVQYEPWLALYFISVILILPVIVLNLVTGVIVSATQNNLDNDKLDALRADKRKLAARLKEVFLALDLDGSGTLSKQEIITLDESDRMALRDACSIGDPLLLFHALDPEDTDTLSIEDFCNGVWRLATAKQSIESQLVERQAFLTNRRLTSFQAGQEHFHSSLQRVRDLNSQFLESLSQEACVWCPSDNGCAKAGRLPPRSRSKQRTRGARSAAPSCRAADRDQETAAILEAAQMRRVATERLRPAADRDREIATIPEATQVCRAATENL